MYHMVTQLCEGLLLCGFNTAYQVSNEKLYSISVIVTSCRDVGLDGEESRDE